MGLFFVYIALASGEKMAEIVGIKAGLLTCIFQISMLSDHDFHTHFMVFGKTSAGVPSIIYLVEIIEEDC